MCSDPVAPSSEFRRAASVTLLRERLCLDLVNSANWVDEEVADEAFERADDVMTWAARALPLDAGSLGAWRASTAPAAGIDAAGTDIAMTDADPVDADRTGPARRLIAVRGTIRRALLGIGTPEFDPLATELLRAGMPAPPRLEHGRLVFAAATDPEASWLTALCARSALDLALSADAAGLRRCEGERCGWLFLDLSASRRRRWCMMSTCGNRAKTRAHYERRRARVPGGAPKNKKASADG